MEVINVHYLFEPAELEQATVDLFTDHTRTCIECGATFQTCGKGRRCSGCLVRRVGAPATENAARITCRVCDAKVTVTLDHPALLCPHCMEDLDGSRARVATWLEKALERLDRNKDVWDRTLANSAVADRWPAIQGALIAVAEKRATQAQLDATWAKRKAEGGPLARLLANYELYAAECDQLAEELNRIYAAQAEINTAFLNETL